VASIDVGVAAAVVQTSRGQYLSSSSSMVSNELSSRLAWEEVSRQVGARPVLQGDHQDHQDQDPSSLVEVVEVLTVSNQVRIHLQDRISTVIRASHQFR